MAGTPAPWVAGGGWAVVTGAAGVVVSAVLGAADGVAETDGVCDAAGVAVTGWGP
ncbi:MAG TPA: hypothetical protein VIK31_07460 [Propionibacteriaceae bacterium]